MVCLRTPGGKCAPACDSCARCFEALRPVVLTPSPEFSVSSWLLISALSMHRYLVWLSNVSGGLVQPAAMHAGPPAWVGYLQARCNYSVAVQAVSSAGAGGTSEPLLIRTSAPSLPIPPRELLLNQVSDESLVLEWHPPIDSGGISLELFLLLLELMPKGDAVNGTTQLHNLSAVFTGGPAAGLAAGSVEAGLLLAGSIGEPDAGRPSTFFGGFFLALSHLQEGSSYSFRIRSVNALGSSDWSSILNVKTLNLFDLHAHCIGAGSLSLGWPSLGWSSDLNISMSAFGSVQYTTVLWGAAFDGPELRRVLSLSAAISLLHLPPQYQWFRVRVFAQPLLPSGAPALSLSLAPRSSFLRLSQQEIMGNSSKELICRDVASEIDSGLYVPFVCGVMGMGGNWGGI